jgi:hypothetical protein
MTNARMMTDEEMGRTAKHWQCNCGSAHFLTIAAYGDGDAYLDVHGSYRASGRKGLLHRVVACWQMLTSGHANTWVELGLTTQSAREIADTLSQWADAGKEKEGNNDSGQDRRESSRAGDS